jgi:hypothetical protein
MGYGTARNGSMPPGIDGALVASPSSRDQDLADALPSSSLDVVRREVGADEVGRHHKM